jgi:DNA-binding Lrp family transcriptional regulator
VTEVYSVAGDHGIIAIVRVKVAEDLARIVTEKFASVRGITKTKTQIAFACFSNYDLEDIFSMRMGNSKK